MHGFSILLIQQLSKFSHSTNYKSIAEIVLGSGLFAFLIAEFMRNIRHIIKKRKYVKELAFEYFGNEYVIKLILKDYQELKKNSCRYLERHRFNTIMDNLIITSGYFTNFEVGLSRFIAEFHYRFDKANYELASFFKLQDEEKIKPQNVEHLNRGERDAEKLLNDFCNSPVMNKLKKKYFLKWQKEKIKQKERISSEKMGRKEKREILSYCKKEISKK